MKCNGFSPGLRQAWKKGLKGCLLLLMLLPLTVSSDVFSHHHWREVLEKYVDDRGMVDYHALAVESEALDEYLAQLKSTGPRTHPELFPDQNHELAYYINAYNALVIGGVIARGPERKSVWRGLISGFNFFVLMDVELDGIETNLKRLEDDIIRSRFKDPRIHAAINCASISCPRLPKVPFTGDRLQHQLDAAIREFVNDPSHVRITGRTVYLSKIFDWFESDFLEADGSLVDYINQYRTDEIPTTLPVKFLPYDKGINQQR